MHYYIDGYNLLFRTVGPVIDDLKNARELLIYSVNEKIADLGLDVTIVFDSQYLIGEGSRGHYKNLEICFTPAGETADDFILHALRFCSNPQHVMVITSDRDLAVRVRHFDASTQTIEQFLCWLNKRYKNKCKERKPKTILKCHPIETLPSQESISPITPKAKLPPLEGSEEYYLMHFEEELKHLSPPKRKPKTESKKKPKRQAPEMSIEDVKLSEEERWLRIFEQRLKEH